MVDSHFTPRKGSRPQSVGQGDGDEATKTPRDIRQTVSGRMLTISWSIARAEWERRGEVTGI
jgi:hypothetical protein